MDKALGPWTDVYLLGAILHEIITGKPPHGGTTMIEVLLAASQSKRPSLPTKTPGELQDICIKAMSREVAERQATLVELRDAVRNFLQHRESTRISDQAGRILEQCQEQVQWAASVNKLPSDRERNQLYADFAGAVAGFQQASLLWTTLPPRAGSVISVGRPRFHPARGRTR